MAEHFLTQVNALPEELAEIMMQNWDYTGRPTNDNPQSQAIIAILRKNADKENAGRAFMDDMKLVFPEMPEYESATYYNVFIDGVKLMSEKMIGEFKKGRPNSPM